MTPLTYLAVHEEIEKIVRTRKIKLSEEERSNVARNAVSWASYSLPHASFTQSEARILALLVQNAGNLVERDDIAKALWNEAWYNKYSDWTIDAHISHIRKKLNNSWEMTTVKNRGVILHKGQTITIPKRSPLPVTQTEGTLPTEQYLTYMNDPSRIRKTLKDLWRAVEQEHLKPITANHPTILVVNSYSFDNVDAMAAWTKTQHIDARILFTNFDERALQIHKERIQTLHKEKHFHVLFDDIRSTRLAPSSCDLVINDFRLNFNTSYAQDVQTMRNMKKLLTPTGNVLCSVVVDGRYESDKYGTDQEKAPINKNKPWIFSADEGLKRHCHTVPYYKQLFATTGFRIKKEFDLKEGKEWQQLFKSPHPTTTPHFRRFILQKEKNN